LIVKVAWIPLPIQFFAGGAVLGVFLAITSLFSSGALYDGLLSFVGAGLIGAFLASIAMVLALLIGLPLRISRRLHHWWMLRGWWMAFGCTALGLIGIIVSFTGQWGSDLYVPSEGAGIPGGVIRKPSAAVSFGSIGVAALGLCHLLIPMKQFKASCSSSPSKVNP
jgi:hypothetical protein